MKKLNQRGALDMMFVVLLVVLLAFGGFVVWRVTAADNETADSAVSTQAGSESKISADVPDNEACAEAYPALCEYETILPQKGNAPDGWLEYQDSAISFQLPEDWLLKRDAFEFDGSITTTILVLSPDFSGGETSYDEITSGARVSVAYREGERPPSIIEQMASTYDKVEVEISGIEGYEETSLYEGSPNRCAIVEQSGFEYFVCMRADGDGSDVYKNIIDTLSIKSITN